MRFFETKMDRAEFYRGLCGRTDRRIGEFALTSRRRFTVDIDGLYDDRGST